jgi:hypothetical protein
VSEIRREARVVSRGRASSTPFLVLLAVAVVLGTAVGLVVGIVALVIWLI